MKSYIFGQWKYFQCQLKPNQAEAGLCAAVLATLVCKKIALKALTPIYSRSLERKKVQAFSLLQIFFWTQLKIFY